MEQTARYWLTLAFLFMSFGYTADGYQAAAYLFSCFAIYTAVDAHSYRTVYRRWKQILCFSSIAALVTVLTGLTQAMPAVWFVTAASVCCCIIFEASSVRTMKNTVMWMRVLMFALYLLTLILPYSTYGFTDTMLLITAAFLPIQASYFHKIIVIEMKKSKVRIATRPQLY